MSAAVRTGSWTTGPTPSLISNGAPIGVNGTVRSENKIAASKPKRRMGWSVASIATSGVETASNIVLPLRSARYSGR